MTWLKRRWWMVLVPTLVAASALGMARARANGPWCGMHGHGHAASSAVEVEEHMNDRLDHLLSLVDASAAQRTQTSAVVKGLAPELFKLMNEGRTLRGELKTALLAEKLDSQRITDLKAELADLSERFVETSMDGVVKMSAVLTPAQRKQIGDKLAHMHM